MAEPVSNKDIMATLADFLGTSMPHPIPGDSFLPAIESAGFSPGDAYFELDRGADWKGIRRGDWKFIVRPKKDKGSGVLFNIALDRAEQNPVQQTEIQTAAQLRLAL